MKPKIAVVGGGSWATAIIKMLSDNTMPKEIFWWMRCAESVAHVQKYKHNPRYLSSVAIQLPEEHISTNLKSTIAKADFILLCVPAAFLKEALSDITPEDFKGKKVISAIKGIVPDENQIIGEFLNQHYHVHLQDILVISGPCHAEEVALEKLSYLTIASPDITLAEQFAAMLATRSIKTNVSEDIYGTEYAAVLKNIYAVASGICHGLGYGDNFQAVLIANAIREISRFVDVVHPINRDINESAYLGDLLVTAYSQFSRNRTFGTMIGKGYTVKSAQLEMNMIAEGYYATKSAYLINQAHENSARTPIIKMVYDVLYKEKNPKEALRELAEKLD